MENVDGYAPFFLGVPADCWPDAKSRMNGYAPEKTIPFQGVY